MSVTATPLKLDTTVCDRCGRCVPVCKPKALRIGPGYIYVDWERCDSCGRCADVCDAGAISVRREGGSAVVALPTKAKPPAPGAVTAAAPAAAGWTLPEGGLALVAAFALLVGVQALVARIAGTAVWSGLALLAYDAVLGALLWYLARRHGQAPLAAFRLDVWPEWTSALLSLPVAVGCWLFSVTYRAAAIAIGFVPPASEGVDLTGLFGAGILGIVLTAVVVAVVGPALEEVLLRGVVMGAARRRVGMWPAIVLSAAAFALLHASLWSALPLAVLGIGLGWLAARGRSLWPAIAAHVLYNGVLVAAAFLHAAR
jgi:uncharacterized protein